jgi:hypothetical protein
MYVIDDLSTFDLELKHLVSESTAMDMCKIDLNPYSSHRMFNGKLSKINFEFSKRDEDEDKIDKINEKIGLGNIDLYIDGEVIFDSDETVADEKEELPTVDDSKKNKKRKDTTPDEKDELPTVNDGKTKNKKRKDTTPDKSKPKSEKKEFFKSEKPKDFFEKTVNSEKVSESSSP